MRRLAAAIVALVPCGALWLVTTAAEDPAEKGAALYRAERWSEAAEAFASDAANAYNLGNALARAGRMAEAIAAYDRALAADSGDGDAAFNRSLVESLTEGAPAPVDRKGSANSAASRARDAHDLSGADGEEGGSGDGFAGSREGASKSGSQGGSKAGKFGKGEQSTTESGQGQARGSAGDSDGAGRTGGTQVDIAQSMRDRDRRLLRRREARSVQPTTEWLSSLPDDPGRFLKLRILAEKARRKARPDAESEEEDR